MDQSSEAEMTEARTRDEQEILAIVDAMFDAIGWSGTKAPDLARFSAAVLPSATIVPSARPAATTDIAAFAARMGDMHARKAMATFEERPLGTIVHVFGNIAVAIGGFEASVDGGAPARGANGFLFVRDEGAWRIAGMAWDNEGETVRLPAALAG